jgi:hypothetical protein
MATSAEQPPTAGDAGDASRAASDAAGAARGLPRRRTEPAARAGDDVAVCRAARDSGDIRAPTVPEAGLARLALPPEPPAVCAEAEALAYAAAVVELVCDALGLAVRLPNTRPGPCFGARI